MLGKLRQSQSWTEDPEKFLSGSCGGLWVVDVTRRNGRESSSWKKDWGRGQGQVVRAVDPE